MSDPISPTEAARLLAEALPYVRFDAGYWHEDASEAQNRRRQSESLDLEQRIMAALAAHDDPTAEPVQYGYVVGDELSKVRARLAAAESLLRRWRTWDTEADFLAVESDTDAFLAAGGVSDA